MRFPADHLRLALPESMDQNAKTVIMANAQNLYLPLPKRKASFSFGISPSFIILPITVKQQDKYFVLLVWFLDLQTAEQQDKAYLLLLFYI